MRFADCCTYHNGNCDDVEEACCPRCPTWTGTKVAWRAVTCDEADRVRATADHVSASRTDLSGQFGPPEVYSEWWRDGSGAVLREHRYPSESEGEPDRRPCEHLIPALIQ